MLSYELFVENMTGLGEVFNTEITDSLLKIYYLALQDLQDHEFKSAVTYIIQNHVYNTLPKPAEFLQYFKADDDVESQSALLKLEDAISKHGYYDSVQFDDPRIHKAIEHMGGWMRVSEMEEKDWKFAKHDFLKIYKTLLRRSAKDCPTKVAGFFETDNINRGTLERLAEHLKPQTKYIGGPKVIPIKQEKRIEGC